MQIAGHELWLIQAVDRNVANVINEAAQKLQSRHCCCWRIYVVAHSQGTMIVKRSLKLVDSEAKSHLYLVGLGGQTSFNTWWDGVAFTHNIANKHDLVPILRIVTPLFDAFDSVDKFEDENWWGMAAHGATNSYLPYLQAHDVPGFLVP